MIRSFFSRFVRTKPARVTGRTTRRRRLEPLEPRTVLDSVVVFNEVMYHPADGDAQGEWIELRNLLSVDVDISDWQLTDGVRYDFPAGTVIPADGFLLVASQPAEPFLKVAKSPVVGPWAGSLDNAGERIELRNNSNRLMDSLRYDDRTPWPVGSDGAGVSLAKRDAYWTSTDRRNWEHSVSIGGTPGSENNPKFDPSPVSTQVISGGDSWAYDASDSEPDAGWSEVGYDDSAWDRGTGVFFAGEEMLGDDTLHVTALEATGRGNLHNSDSYTHLLDFGNADNGAVVEGVSFAKIPAPLLPSVTEFSWDNSSGIVTHSEARDVIPLDGPLRDLYQDYVYNPLHRADGTSTITLHDLQVGTRYRTRIFARRADADTRQVTLQLTHGTQTRSLTLDQNAPDIPQPGAPYSIDYDFEATAESLTITAVQHQGNRPWLWYGLSNEFVSPHGSTQLPLGSTTHYFRKSFTYDGEPLANRSLRLDWLVDDGAVVYLNGSEIHRDNLPDGPIQASTSALRNIGPDPQRAPVELPADRLRIAQPNVLAIAVHQAVNGNPDLRFDAALDVIEHPRPPVEPPELWLNELPSSGDDARFVELINRGRDSVPLSAVRLVWQGDEQRPIPLPERLLGSMQIVSVPVPSTFPDWDSGERLWLFTQDSSTLIDAQSLANQPKARSWQDMGRWLRPSVMTPGTTNQFAINHSIVINEIMYHAAPQFAQGEQPFRESSEEWIELYNRGSETIDLSGWTFGGGIEFVFPAETRLPPNQYLVVSNQATQLQLKWPGATIVGNFQSQLGNAGDLIVLSDRVGNPVDEVHYFDKGTWPAAADGGGSSIELIDPFADNQRPEAWRASDESAKSSWVTLTYEGRARPPRGSNDPNVWNEFIVGLLDAGEVLVDDISVLEDPHGAAIERIQNGSFNHQDAHWRWLGNHGQHGDTRVVVDPDDPDNHVLHLVATGATGHMNNHVETTFVDNARIRSSETYRISLRARWLSGSPQLQTRLYFNRLAATHILPQPAAVGTPGAINSRFIENVGPTFSHFAHRPAVPHAGEPVVVSADIADTDGIEHAMLHYRVEEQPFESLTMRQTSGSSFAATIPGLPPGQLVQFYIEATDGVGNQTSYPALGQDSRALYRVDAPSNTDGPRHQFRLLMTESDLDVQFTRVNYTSNQRLGATVIWRDSQVYYDVQVRLKGSGFSRGSAATGFNLRFSPDQLLFGEHDVVAIDRQGGPWGIGASHRELIIKQIANRAGDIPMMYDDVIELIGPLDHLSGSAQLLVARYDDLFLESQFENGGEGTRFKFELIYYSTLTLGGDPEDLKLPPSSSPAGVFPVRGINMPYMGEDAEAYRWYYLIRNNRDRDDYSQIIALTEALRSSSSAVGGPLDMATRQVMDVDQWMRLFAFESLAGINDTFNQGLEHNLQLYVRPSDRRVVALPWDMDFAFHHATTMSIYGTGSRLSRVINVPTNRRLFQQHLLDIIETSYNEDYLAPWVAHIGSRAEENASDDILSYVSARRRFVLNRLDDPIEFEITTPNHDALEVDSLFATLEGNGWIDVRQIRLAGHSEPLDVEWRDRQRWRVRVPLRPGLQTVRLEAVNRQGKTVGTATASIASNASSPLLAGLRITELNYHPADPVAAEQLAGWTDDNDFEFVELTNVGTAPLQLAGVQFQRNAHDGSGIEFVFPDITLQSGASVLVVNNAAAFRVRYGNDLLVVGEYQGQLSNGGETLQLATPSGEQIQRLRYDDAWYPQSDGDGATLELRSPETAEPQAWSTAAAWRASSRLGGTPGWAIQTDLNQDGKLDFDDVDLLCAAVRDNQDAPGDFNHDGAINHDDLMALVVDAIGLPIGDVTMDGRFDSSDLVSVFQHGEYEDAIDQNSTYRRGDWNCDGDFTTRDLVFAFQHGGGNR